MRCYFPFKKKGEDLLLPCGKCPYCLNRRANNWIFRLQQELKRADSAVFVTLTYENPPLSFNNVLPTVYKPDVQKFFKRLRKIPRDYSNQPIKYYLCAEYGSKSFRPHYHAIIFNSDIESIQECWKGQFIPSNAVLPLRRSSWRFDNKNFKWIKKEQPYHINLDTPIILGYCHFGDVNEATISYTTKYMNKGKLIPYYLNDDRHAEFQLFSKGLGSNFSDDIAVQRFYLSDPSKNYVTINGFKKPLPRYFKDKLFTDEDKELQRKIAQYQAVTTFNSQFDEYTSLNLDISFEQWRYEKKKAALAAFAEKLKKRKDI